MIVFVTYVMYQEERRLESAVEVEAGLETAAEAAGSTGAASRGGKDSSTDGPRIGTSEPPVAGLDNLDPAAESTRNFAPARDIPRRTSTLQNEQVIAKISNGPGLIESWQLREFMERLPDGDIPIELMNGDIASFATDVGGVSGSNFSRANFEVVRESSREVVQRATSPGGVLTRTIRLDDEGYGFDLELSFESLRNDPVDARFEIFVPAEIADRNDFRELSLIAYGEDEGVTREFVQGIGQAGFFSFGATGDGTERIDGRSKWAGFDAQFFSGLVIDPQDRGRFDVEFTSVVEGVSAQARVSLPGVGVPSGGVAVDRLRGFLGPKTSEALDKENAGLEYSVDRGWSWLEPLTRFFEIALDKLYIVIPNYGFAIIVLTIMVRIVTAPLMVRQMRSAERMREVQPKLKALQERFKDNKQKQSEEMMKFYREEGINPLGGCLPLLLQMPVLIGLFYALRTSIGLRHAPFIFWIDDLSQPATLFTVPGFDFPVRILPLIMGASMFVQQKMMPQTGMDPVQARMMLIMMPGMMLLISYTFPSGLVLYWTVSNLLGIAHQYWVRNHMQLQK
jgi:YidC/Oxa1 family membrane protein insertase